MGHPTSKSWKFLDRKSRSKPLWVNVVSRQSLHPLRESKVVNLSGFSMSVAALFFFLLLLFRLLFLPSLTDSHKFLQQPNQLFISKLAYSTFSHEIRDYMISKSCLFPVLLSKSVKFKDQAGVLHCVYLLL